MSEIVSIRKVKNGSLQAEIMGTIHKPGSVNVLQLLNKGDDRFQTGSQRRAWFPVTTASLSDLGMSSQELAKVEAMEEGGKTACSIENPVVNGEYLEIQVKEFITPDEYQAANIMKTAKRILIDEKVTKNQGLTTDYDLTKYEGQYGYFLDKDGNHIFSRTVVTVASQVKNVFVSGSLVPEKELANAGATLAPATPAFQEENA